MKGFKLLLISAMVSMINLASFVSINDVIGSPPTPESGGLIGTLKYVGSTMSWLFAVVFKVMYLAIYALTFPGYPTPLRVPLTLIFGGMFLVGIISVLMELVKSMGGGLASLILK